MLLTDIAIEHEYRGKKAPTPLRFTMHPFVNDRGEGKGQFEVLGNLPGPGKLVKRSIHVTQDELAELYARGLVEQLGLRLRLRAASGHYPDAPPGKKVPRRCISVESSFDRQVVAIDLGKPISQSLRMKLESTLGWRET
jgi:hypothetical protein